MPWMMLIFLVIFIYFVVVNLSELYRKLINLLDLIMSNMAMGCEHYERNCKFVAPCCGNIYTCRFCHDDKEDHPINRHEVNAIMCAKCATVQRVQVECENCGLRFGKYSCLKCRLFDNKDKGQFHCEGCGICRIGGEENYFHCLRCNLCLPKSTDNSHKCVENASRADCPVCLEYLHTSRDPCHVPSCGHLLHMTCYRQLYKSGFYFCPSCCVRF